MNRISLACYGLIASAFVLAALLTVNLGSVTSTAEAEMVIARDNFTLMTAQTRADEESLFLLDNTTGRLLVYTLNLGRKELELGANVNLGDIFNLPAGGPAQGR